MGSFHFPFVELRRSEWNYQKRGKIMSTEKNSLREEARKAKLRIKSGFWAEADADRERKIEKAR